MSFGALFLQVRRGVTSWSTLSIEIGRKTLKKRYCSINGSVLAFQIHAKFHFPKRRFFCGRLKIYVIALISGPMLTGTRANWICKDIGSKVVLARHLTLDFRNPGYAREPRFMFLCNARFTKQNVESQQIETPLPLECYETFKQGKINSVIGQQPLTMGSAAPTAFQLIECRWSTAYRIHCAGQLCQTPS